MKRTICLSAPVLFKLYITITTEIKRPLKITTTKCFATQSRIIGAYWWPTLNYRGQLSLYFPHMLRINMTRDLAHLQLPD